MTPLIDPETGEIRRCTAITSAGQPCQAMPIGDTGLCVFHTPSFQKEGEEGRTLGGRRYSVAKIEGLPDGVKEPKDVLAALNVLIGETSRRDCSPSTIASLCKLYALCLDVMQGAAMEERVRELEQIAEAQDAQRR